MAAAASLEDVCEWCFDTRPLKIVGRCKHRFCVECLTITLASQKGDVFACPTCNVDCQRPWDGVKGMKDVPVIYTVMKTEPSFGRWKWDDKEEEEGDDDNDEPKELFDTYDEHHKVMFIPCVANLGQMFAVLRPASLGEPSTAIDIYELSAGKMKHTLKDHVPPVYDMASTADGKLAVLSDGTGGTGCSVKLFDLDAGHVSFTHDINIAEPLSLGVTLQHQYVILGGNEQGQKVITVVHKSGVVEKTLTIDKVFAKKELESDEESDHNVRKDTKGDSDYLFEYDTDDESTEGVYVASSYHHDIPKRIACGGRFIFVMGNCTVAVYEITDTGIHVRKIIKLAVGRKFTDISATIWDDFFVTNDANECVWLQEWVMNQKSKCEWDSRGLRHMFHVDFGDDRPSRVSIRDRHAVVCQGERVRVLKIKE